MIAVAAENLSKQYSLGQQADAYLSLRDLISTGAASAAKRLFGSAHSNGNGPRGSRGKFFALDDVSFQLEEGAALGLIGRNGSGKSTLLRILSRITTPTSGRVRIRGRLASLLEVGTGFHGELTGRENILLNAAILGMKHAEIKARFDEIVAFAEIDDFLDTPVKRYSSGMFIRLAFAVAAHLEPDILLVDEVLAVGDAAFQKKCVAKLGEAGQEGRTIVFVSHNMNAVEQLCRSAILLDSGKLITHSDDVGACIREYARRAGAEVESHRWENTSATRIGDGFEPHHMYIGDRDGSPLPSPLSSADEAWVHIEGRVDEQAAALKVGYSVLSSDGILLYSTWQSDDSANGLGRLPAGDIHLRSRIPSRLLNEGTYRIEMSATVQGRPVFQSRESAPTIAVVVGADLYATQFWMLKRPGLLAPPVVWESARRVVRADIPA
jgi:lipopolysaccharide transport system ATP-binding protein